MNSSDGKGEQLQCKKLRERSVDETVIRSQRVRHLVRKLPKPALAAVAGRLTPAGTRGFAVPDEPGFFLRPWFHQDNHLMIESYLAG